MKKEYLKYDVPDLAADENFIDWIKEGKNDTEWKRWLNEHSDFYEIVDKATVLVESVNFGSFKLEESVKKDLWVQIDNATISNEKSNNTRRIFMISSISAAAAVILILYSIFLKPSEIIDINTQIGTQEIVSLPDNSTIKLNAVSRVQYNDKTFDSDRVLNLEGEGFFEVEKGSTFTVLTDYGSVQVLGTSFNVYSRDDSLSVACFTGRVKVSKGASEVILNPGESVSYNRDAISIGKETFEKEEDNPSWTKGMFTFENQKLSVVFKELSRQFDIEISYDDKTIADLMVGVAFFESGSLDKALEEITYPYSLTYTKNGKKVVIKKQ